MDDVERIDPREARSHLSAGKSLLVCAYDDRAKCAQHRLDGAMDLQDFQAIEDELPHQQEVIFYCG
jgi:hypothetical protein